MPHIFFTSDGTKTQSIRFAQLSFRNIEDRAHEKNVRENQTNAKSFGAITWITAH